MTKPGNQAPTLTAKVATTDQDTPVTIDLLVGAHDADGDHLTVVAAFAGGHSVQLAPSGVITVTPRPSFLGTITVSYTVSDGIHQVNGTATVIVRQPNHMPTAINADVQVARDTPVFFMLQGNDPDGDPLSYAIAMPPTHGTLSGNAPSLTYTPAPGFAGSDAMTFTVNDGHVGFGAGTVTFHVSAPNHPPEATPQTVSATEDTNIDITMTGTDPDGDSLAFSVQSEPQHGTLSIFGAAVTYRPSSNFHGQDSFTFVVIDRVSSSAPATVTIDVASVNDAPTVVSMQRNLDEDASVGVTLQGADTDGDAFTFAISTPPQHGTLTGEPPAMTYIPNPNFNGTDSFQYTASDGTATSVPATVTLFVAAVNDAPVAVNSSVATVEETAVTIPLQASDVDSPTLTYSILALPSDGTLSGTGASRMYMPALNAIGVRTFRFQVSDGFASASATVTITITPVNDPPKANDDWVSTDAQTPAAISVLRNDIEVDGDPLTITAVGTPAHGTVNIVADKLLYTPDAGFQGVEVFTYTIADPAGLSSTATVHLGVGLFPPGAPTETLPGVAVFTNDPRYAPSVSSDGRYIAFSTPTALVPGDTSGGDDVYVYDRGARTFARMSETSSGTQANGSSRNARISPDGRYVVFESDSTTLVPGDTNGALDVFRHDRVTGETVRISVASDGSQGNGASSEPRLSDDGNVIAFMSSAFNLTANDANGVPDIFVRDLIAGTTTRVSVSTTGGDVDLASSEPALSGDGRFIAFTSQGTNLVASDTNNVADIFVRDRLAGTTTRASVSSTGVEANKRSFGPSLSGDGRFISFLSDATNLLPGGDNVTQVYIRDAQGGTTTRPPLFSSSDWARLSGDGRYLASTVFNAVAICDRFAATTVGLPGSSTWRLPTLSSNARYVAVVSTSGGGTLVVAPNPL